MLSTLSMLSTPSILRRTQATTQLFAGQAHRKRIVWKAKDTFTLRRIPLELGSRRILREQRLLTPEAECTGDVSMARLYDRWHALWHVSVAASTSEVFLLGPAADSGLYGVLQSISPLSTLVLVCWIGMSR